VTAASARRHDTRAAQEPDTPLHVLRTGGQVDQVRLRQLVDLALAAGPAEQALQVAFAVLPARRHLTSEGLEALLEIAVEQSGVGHGAVEEHHRAAGPEAPVGVLGAGGGLGVVAEAGEKEVLRHLAGKARGGRAGGHEQAPVERIFPDTLRKRNVEANIRSIRCNG
jgi:hypothetical protein